MKRLLSLSMVLVLLATLSAQAQIRIGYQEGEKEKRQKDKSLSPYLRYNSYQLTLRYGVAQPTGGMSTYLDQLSSTQIALSGELVYTQNYSLGVQFQSGVFKQRLPRQIYNFDGTDISAVQTRTLSHYALLGHGSYYFTPVTSIIRPYVRAGVGLAIVDYVNYWGLIDDSKNSFTFTTQTATGLKVLFGKESHWGLDIQANYQYTPFTYDYITNVSTFGGSVGLSYRWW
ncbi:MAG: hypothetical protein U0Y10_14450 [Spirosomataceae bacterium]